MSEQPDWSLDDAEAIAEASGKAKPEPEISTPSPSRRTAAWEASHTIQVGEQAFLLRGAGRIDPTQIPPRGWLLGTSFARKFLSGVSGPGGAGKTCVRCAQYVALATGRNLTGEPVHHRSRVVIVGLEDDLDEMERRIAATMLHHRIDPAEVEGWIYYCCPRGLHLMKLADGSRNTAMPAELYAILRAIIMAINPDLISLDPWVKASGVPENDNNLNDQVCILLANLADEFNITFDLLSHVRKGSNTPGDAEQDRGASAKKDAGRLMRTITPMSADEAAMYDIKPADRRQYVRVDDAKLNITLHGEECWFHLASVRLGNNTDLYPNGDSVQAAEGWRPPRAFDDVTTAMACQVIDEIEQGLPNGQRYSGAAAARERAAWKVVQKHTPTKSPAHCRMVVNGWLKTGVLIDRPYHNDERREDKKGLFADPAKRPGGTHVGMPD
jgi:hypothetical protein